MDLDVKIARLCGWKRQRGTPITYGGSYIPAGWVDPQDRFHRSVPDYHKDLRAAHRMEQTLAVEQIPGYVRHIWDQVAGTVSGHPDRACYAIAHASAAQRATAFLRLHEPRRLSPYSHAP